MKKLFLLLVSIILISGLSACATMTKDFELTQNRENVQSVEIYNSEQAYYEGDIHQFRDENEPIVLLSGEENSTFLDGVGSLKFEEEKVFFPIPMDSGYDYQGYIVVIVYTDGGYDLLSENGQYFYSIEKDGQGRHKYDHSDYCGDESWSDFIGRYIGK